MHRLSISAILGLCVAGLTIAQPPRKLPSALDDPARDRPAAPLSPADAARQRADTIKAVKEDVRSFDPATVTVAQVEGRWQLRTPTDMLKSFGQNRTAAFEALRLIQDLRLNQLGTVPGAQPPFEYWLVDGKAPRGTNMRITVVPISARTIRAESVGGTWAVTDGTKGLYDFGADAEAATRAATIYWKHGFNQIGVIGSPQPAMLWPLQDPRQKSLDKVAPLPNPQPLGVLSDVSRTSLLLPGNAYAGAKSAIDVRKLETVRSRTGEWALTHAGNELARFGSSEQSARAAMKILQDTRPTEMVRVGEGGLPLFLAEGLPIRGEPLGATKTVFRADRLKVQKLRDRWWLFDEIRPLVEIGSQNDAELWLRLIKQYDLKCLCFYGRPEAGGLRLFTAGR